MNNVDETRAGEKLYLPSQTWNETSVLAMFYALFDDGLNKRMIVDFARDSTFDVNFGYQSHNPEFFVTGRCQFFIHLHGELIKVQPPVLGDILSNYEYGGVDAVDAFLESTHSKVSTSCDEAEIGSHVHLQHYAEPEVLELMKDVLHYDINGVANLYDGMLDGVVIVEKECVRASTIQVNEISLLKINYREEPLMAMSVSDFGNFLNAIKDDDDNELLVRETLNHIYSNP
jgi:hypothetical protein